MPGWSLQDLAGSFEHFGVRQDLRTFLWQPGIWMSGWAFPVKLTSRP